MKKIVDSEIIIVLDNNKRPMDLVRGTVNLFERMPPCIIQEQQLPNLRDGIKKF